MNPSHISPGHAIGITAEGIIPLKENDTVILGIKCWIDKDGNAVPCNDRLQLLRKELNAELNKDVFLFKRINIVADENNKPDSGKTE